MTLDMIYLIHKIKGDDNMDKNIMNWQEILEEAQAYRKDAMQGREMTKEEVVAFMFEIEKAIKNSGLK